MSACCLAVRRVCKQVTASVRQLLVSGAVALTLAGCVPTTPAPISANRSMEFRADSEAAAGNLRAATEIYGQLADATRGSQRAGYLLSGARLLIRLGDLGSARRWLTRARADADPGQQQLALALSAELERLGGLPGAALDMLALLPSPPPYPLVVETSATRGQALFQLGRTEEAVRTLVEREIWLNDSGQVLENHRMIWEGLKASLGGLVGTGDPIIDGWLALQPAAAATRSNPFGLEEDLRRWLELNRDHPAAGALMSELLGESVAGQTYPSQIALLLPLSSSQQASAQAVRDGFVAAHLSNPQGGRVRLKIYDTAAMGVSEAYQQAQLDGAGFVVGPLLKPGVEEVARAGGTVPTLALNFTQTDGPPPAGFFQFALAPEDEAREVARHAIAGGAVTAVALVPNNDWGIRLLDSFRAEFEALGGRLLHFRGYAQETQDFSLAITTLLNLDNSHQRYQRLLANLGTAVEFEPRRRQDVDIIFVAALPRTGRLLAPQLRFHYAGDIPTYATSDVYVPGSETGNSDLNGLLFPDTPWVLAPDPNAVELKRALERYWPQRAPPLVRLYGLGFDAYRLIPMLYDRRGLFAPVSGMSGELMLEADGRIHRRLPLAQFRNGRPVALATDVPPHDAELAGSR